MLNGVHARHVWKQQFNQSRVVFLPRPVAVVIERGEGDRFVPFAGDHASDAVHPADRKEEIVVELGLDERVASRVANATSTTGTCRIQ